MSVVVFGRRNDRIVLLCGKGIEILRILLALAKANHNGGNARALHDNLTRHDLKFVKP
uniref:Transposase n=1 Tax=Steinernema glaseri TaxID=37863 RepID=A0A1I7ZDR9_9BILA